MTTQEPAQTTDITRREQAAADRRAFKEANLAAARDFRQRMQQAWKDAEWPEERRGA